MTDGEPDRRIVERCPVEEAARVRALAARNQPQPEPRPVTIANVSVRGAGLRGRDVELVAGHTIELGIDGDWSKCRVVWSQPGLDDTMVAGVEFVDAEPRFLPALLRWIERESAGRAQE